jgi:PAS domain S-box-containing protein
VERPNLLVKRGTKGAVARAHVSLLLTFYPVFALSSFLSVSLQRTIMNPSIVFPLSPAAGIGLALLTLYGVRWVPVVVLSVFTLYLAQWIDPALYSASLAFGESSALVCGALVLRRRGFDPRFGRVTDVVMFITVAAMSAVLSGAIGGVAVAVVSSYRDLRLWSDTLALFATTLTGIVVVAPAVFLWLASGQRPTDPRWWSHVGATVIGVVATSFGVFAAHATRLVRAYFIVPFLVWGALSTGVRGSSALLLLVAAIGTWFTTFGEGPLAYVGQWRFAPLQQFLCVIGTTILFLAVFADERRARTALLEARERLRFFVENAPAAIAMFDREMRYLIASRRWKEVYRIQGDPTGLVHYDLVPWAADRWRDVHRRVVQGETLSAQDEPMRIAAGPVQRVKWEARPWRNLDGTIGGILVASEDVTSRVLDTERIRESESRFRVLFESLPLGAFVIEPGTQRIVDCNEYAARALEYPKEELCRKTVPDIDAQLLPEETAENMRAITERGEHVLLQTKHRTARGEIRDVLITASPIYLSGKSYTYASALDITERVRSEEAIKRSEALLAAVMDSLPVGVWLASSDGKVMNVNRAARAIWGGSQHFGEEERRALKGWWADSHKPVAPQEWALARAVAHGEVVRDEVIDIEAVDGTKKTILNSAMPVYHIDGKVLAIIGVNQDITELKRVERARTELLESEQAARVEVERASRMKDEFLLTVSHELRTPLNAILGWSQLLKLKFKGHDPQLEDGLSVIERNARSQAQLIEDLLDMGGIISGKMRLEVKKMDLQQVVKEAIASIRPVVEVKGISLQEAIEADAEHLTINGDPSRIHQVVWNLLTNAAKFTPKGGSITVSLARRGSHAEIAVRDTGVGIPVEFLSCIFERFRQADSSITRRYSGLGIGLAIAKNIVELHGGTVRVESEGEGRGSTFTVTLPIPALESAEVILPSELVGWADLQGVSALFVDDEADTRDVVSRFLSECHAKVRTAASAEEAMNLLREERPDVLISDVGMPGVDGYEFIRRVRSLPVEGGSKIPAIALTAFARPEDRAKALAAGYDLYLVKPLRPGVLMQAIKDVRMGGHPA